MKKMLLLLLCITSAMSQAADKYTQLAGDPEASQQQQRQNQVLSLADADASMQEHNLVLQAAENPHETCPPFSVLCTVKRVGACLCVIAFGVALALGVAHLANPS